MLKSVSSGFVAWRSLLTFLVFASLAAEPAAMPAAETPPAPDWLWGPNRDVPAWRLEKRWEINDGVLTARLKFAADFCKAAVWINDRVVLQMEPYCPTQTLDVTEYVRRGANELVVSAESVPGPAAIGLSLAVTLRDGRELNVVSGGDWQAAPLTAEAQNTDRVAAESFGPIAAELWGLGRRDITLSPAENYEQWQQTRLADGTPRGPRFWAAPGFEISLLRTAQPEEGSWIALAFDAAGRAVISREDRGLLRLTLDDARRTIARVEPIDVDLLECRGLLFDRDGWLYANANNSKALFRLRLNDDGTVSEKQELKAFSGGVGHGRNDLALGPDGRLNSIHGDAVDLPDLPDLTSPLRESRREKHWPGGYLVRGDRDGTNWRIVCTGLRNPYGVAFNPAGDVFTYDADNEFDMGTPWYRPTRMVQLLSGADYGWRDSGRHWPPYFPDQPDHAPPLIDIGRGSPTSVMFGTELAFPPVYRRAMYVLDWTYGRVLAVHLAPRGAGYRAATELFLQGKPLNVTDIAAGPDGAMYLTTGGRKTQSALYRVAYVGEQKSAAADDLAGDHEHQSADFARQQRDLRTRLESFHGRVDPAAIETAWPHLADADPLIRHAARIAVEHQPVESWRQRAMDSGANPAGLAAWLALARSGSPDVLPPLLDGLTAAPIDKLGLGARLELLRLHELCRQTAPDAVAARRDAIVRQLRSVPAGTMPAAVSSAGTNDQWVRRLALLLGELHSSAALDVAAEPLLTSPVQEDRLAGLLAVRQLREGWTLERRRLYFAALRDSAHFVGGDGMNGFLEKLREEALATLSEAERTALAGELQPAAPVDDPPPPARPILRPWTLADLEPLLAEAAPRGDARHGAAVFRDALCTRCHRVGLRGPAVGPDLTFVARRFSRRDMLESILTPSLSVAENYRNVSVELDSGKVHSGRVVSEGDYRSQTLRLNTDPLRPSQIIDLDKREIADFRLLDTSPMPQGLLDTFSLDDIRDLLAFLESGDPSLRP